MGWEGVYTLELFSSLNLALIWASFFLRTILGSSRDVQKARAEIPHFAFVSVSFIYVFFRNLQKVLNKNFKFQLSSGARSGKSNSVCVTSDELETESIHHEQAPHRVIARPYCLYVCCRHRGKYFHHCLLKLKPKS